MSRELAYITGTPSHIGSCSCGCGSARIGFCQCGKKRASINGHPASKYILVADLGDAIGSISAGYANPYIGVIDPITAGATILTTFSGLFGNKNKEDIGQTIKQLDSAIPQMRRKAEDIQHELNILYQKTGKGKKNFSELSKIVKEGDAALKKLAWSKNKSLQRVIYAQAQKAYANRLKAYLEKLIDEGRKLQKEIEQAQVDRELAIREQELALRKKAQQAVAQAQATQQAQSAQNMMQTTAAPSSAGGNQFTPNAAGGSGNSESGSSFSKATVPIAIMLLLALKGVG